MLELLVNDVKCEHLMRRVSTGVNVSGQTAPHLASSIDTDVYWHALGRVEQSVKPIVTENHSIVQVESAKRISLHHAMRHCQSDVGIDSEVLAFWSTVMTTFPRRLV
jgi:hypothetical protein